MRSPQRGGRRGGCLAILLPLLLAACGERSETSLSVSPSSLSQGNQPSYQNELVVLHPRRSKQPERPAPNGAQDAFAVSTLPPNKSDAEDLVASTLSAWPDEQLAEVASAMLRSKLREDVLTEMPKGFASAPEVSVKITSIQVGGSDVVTQARVAYRGVTGSGERLQHQGLGMAEWTRGGGPSTLALRSFRLENVTEMSGHPLFAEATGTVLEGTPGYEDQVLRGIGHWSERLTKLEEMSLAGHQGFALGDVNGDDLEDLYVCDAGSLPNRLYLQQMDGTLADATEASGADWLEDSRGALLVDLDNDGDQDLVVSTVDLILIGENDGAGHFELRGGHPGAPNAYSLSAADVDGDALLDLYVCAYGAKRDPAAGAREFEVLAPVPFQDAENGGRNLLLKNLGGFMFADATEALGLGMNNHRWSFAAAWEDVDQDGDPDLYVANDFGRNNLYINDQGHFTDRAKAFGVEDMAGGMSVSWGDADRDGWADLYVGNMFSAAGNRVMYQRNAIADRSAEEVAGLQRMSRGNSLFRYRPETANFADVSESAGVTMGRWAWSSGFADLNNDAWEDLVVSNGYITNAREDDL